MPGQDAAVPGPQRPSAARRLAAVAAMMTLVAAAVLLLVSIALHLAAVVAAFISLLVGVTGGWYAVSRRGVVRVIAVAVAAASVAGFGAGLEPVVLRPGDDLLQLAEDAIARGADVIGMAGGDGSQALVASVAARHDIPHVCVPAGTRNHFALDLGLDRSDVAGALDALTDGVERRIDLATVNGRTFVNNASLGL